MKHLPYENDAPWDRYTIIPIGPWDTVDRDESVTNEWDHQENGLQVELKGCGMISMRFRIKKHRGDGGVSSYRHQSAGGPLENLEPHQQAESLPPRTQYLLLLSAVVATLMLYLPRLTTSFVDWDLVAYRGILDTTAYLQTTIRLFTDFQGKVVSGYYAPLASISLMLDKWIIGSSVPSAWFTLLINLLVHCVNGVLVFVLLRELKAGPETALFAAAVFLIHPVQVSSVLWFCQRKGLLAATFYFAAYWSYLRFAETRAVSKYCAALALFALALLTKPTVSMFPVALLVWRLLFASSKDRWSGLVPAVQSFSRHVWSLLPFFLLSLCSGLIAMESERLSMEANTTPNIPIFDRPLIAASAIWFYVGKILLPLEVRPLYPLWDLDAYRAAWYLPVAGLAIAAVLVCYFHRAVGRFPIWCMLNFLIPLVTAIGLLKFGYLRLSYVADHFLYLSMLGMAGLIAHIVLRCYRWVRAGARRWIAVGACIFLVFCGLQTFLYGGAWKDSVTLWTYNLSRDPDNWMSHNYLGHALVTAERPLEAADHFRRTLELKQRYITDHMELSRKLEQTGDISRARKERSKADTVKGTLAVARHNLGNALLLSNMPHEAIEQYKTAVTLDPNLVKALTNLGVSLMAVGNIPEALTHLTRAVELSPNNFEALYNLGFALQRSGNTAAAERVFQRVRVLRPGSVIPELPEK